MYCSEVKIRMPTNVVLTTDITWTRRADPDPQISIGESYNAHQQYQYTWLRIGPVKIQMYGKEKARRVLENLHHALGEAIAVLPAREPHTEQDEPYIPLDEAEESVSVRPAPAWHRKNSKK